MYEQDKLYKIHFVDSTGKEDEIEFTPEEDMSIAKVITYCKENVDKFFKLISVDEVKQESKLSEDYWKDVEENVCSICKVPLTADDTYIVDGRQICGACKLDKDISEEQDYELFEDVDVEHRPYADLEQQIASEIYDYLLYDCSIDLKSDYDEEKAIQELDEYMSDTLVEYMVNNNLDLLMEYILDKSLDTGIKIIVYEV